MQFLKKISLCMAVLAMLLCLCACETEDNSTSSKGGEASIPGKYVLTKVVRKDGEVQTGEEFDRDEFSITLHKDGTAVMISEGDLTDNFNWAYEDGKLYIVAGEQREEIPYSNNTITLVTRKGETWYYTKQ